jgi:hypothetical protein
LIAYSPPSRQLSPILSLFHHPTQQSQQGKGGRSIDGCLEPTDRVANCLPLGLEHVVRRAPQPIVGLGQRSGIGARQLSDGAEPQSGGVGGEDGGFDKQWAVGHLCNEWVSVGLEHGADVHPPSHL